MMSVLLEVKNLTINFQLSKNQFFKAVDNLSFSLKKGEILGLVGESGSGKTVTSLAIMGLLPKTARVEGTVIFDGRQILGSSKNVLSKIRGRRVTMIFQDPTASLNPILTVGEQVEEMISFHNQERLTSREFDRKIVSLFQRVKISDPERYVRAFPGELSGGMNQRVMIAMMSLATKPELVIADELTSALDVTTQAEILDLLDEIVKELGISLIFITHNLGLIAEYSDRVIVMHKGRMIEEGGVEEVFERPQADYTRDLLEAVPRPDKQISSRKKKIFKEENILDVRNLKVYFPVYGGGLFSRKIGEVKAVDGVSFCLKRGEILGIVGESGCGKTTLARSILGLTEIKDGSLLFQGFSINPQRLSNEDRRKIQAVFQDPYQSLNIKMKAGDLVAEGLDIHRLVSSKKERRDRISELLELVGLEPEAADRYPIEFSGGQRQRIAIARALALNPRLLILDEPVSSLDVMVQRKILDLLLDLREELGLSYLFISHDLSVVREICDRVAVMYAGKIIEQLSAEELSEKPLHPYTKALISVVPIPNPRIARSRKKVRLMGEVPSLVNLPRGCRFYPRCPETVSSCQESEPVLIEREKGHLVACHKV
jgi:oligopeptide/dipeptide ABC transporter ATP-binding protein